MAVDMKNGAFLQDNMEVPKGDRVIPLFSLKGRTAIVSGAGAGIGLGIAHGLAEAGANVAIWYNSNKQALVEADNIEKTYGVKCKFPANPWTCTLKRHYPPELTHVYHRQGLSGECRLS